MGCSSIRSAISAIVADAEDAFVGGWPTHPIDSEGPEDDARRFRTVYLGGAGVVQALDALQRRGLADVRRDYVPYLEQPYEPDFADYDHERSLWMGETGIRLVLQRLAPSAENADRLETLIRANAQDERREVMWGSPGTMLAAGALHDLSGEERWLELWRESARGCAPMGSGDRPLGRSGSTGTSTSSPAPPTASPAACVRAPAP